MKLKVTLAAAFAAAFLSMGSAGAGKDDPVQLITLDPGHFHAALVQKFMLPGVSPQVKVFAPAGDDVAQHMKRIESFNKRADNPTAWETEVYTGADFAAKAFAGARAAPTVLVLSGNNAHKVEFLSRGVGAGMHVLADKPMVITPDELPKLEAAFATARKNGVLLYDIMTERFEITTMLQRALSRDRKLFGELEPGTADDPSITKISVHNFSKIVAGAQLKRPQWFFDPKQQGAGIVDVTTHLVDLVQWEAFPDVTLRRDDVKMLRARRWATPLTFEQFGRVTGATQFPEFLATYVKNGVLQAPANGEMTYTLKGIHAKVSVTWDFEAPPGAGDTHFSVMRGTKASLVIKQGKEQGYKPVLYVERASEAELRRAVGEVAKTWPGVSVRAEGGQFVVVVPDRYHNGHEAHFTQVTEAFLKYVSEGKLPEWEVPNMLVKYATIMKAYELSQ